MVPSANARLRPARRPRRSISAPNSPADVAAAAWISVLGSPASASLPRPDMIRLASTVLTVVAPVARACAAYSGASRAAPLSAAGRAASLTAGG